MNKLFSFVVLVFCLTFSHDVQGKNRDHLSKSTDDGRIVGGYNTTIQDVPYQAYLLLRKRDGLYQCGGSIISTRFILTAAHCLKDVLRAEIRIGSTNSNSGGTVYRSAMLLMHPMYNSRTSDYDVGAVRVSREMNLDGTNARKITLEDAENDNIQPGTDVLVSGWGATSENGKTSNTLMAVEVQTVSEEDCNKAYNNGITDRMFCAGEKGKDSCQGDSGGPAVENQTQVGIVSFGIGCARAGYPGVYTKVAAVRRWIRLTTSV